MPTVFPTSIDNFVNPVSTDLLDSLVVPHAAQHSQLNDAVEALEAKVGINGSAVTTSLDYKVERLTATTRQIAGTTDTPTAADAKQWLETTNATAVSVTINGAVFAAKDIINVNQYGAGQVTLVAGSGGMVLRTPATLKTRTQYSTIALRFISATEAVVFGDLATS